MILIDYLRDFIRGLDKKEFRLYVGLYVAMSAMIVVGIMVRHIYLVADAKDKIKQLNVARAKVQKVLTSYGQVAQQQAKIDALLAKDKNFYIQQVFQNMTQKLSIPTDSQPRPSVQKLDNGYIEDSLSISLVKITTQQLCELLKEIAGEERIYIKNIDIAKNLMKKINVTMDIATLRSK